MAKDSLIQFKGTSLKIIQTLLRTTDPSRLHGALAELTGHSPDFFEGELAVLDFSNAEDFPASVDWAQIREMFRHSGLSVVATLGLPEALASAAMAAGLPSVGADALSRTPRSKPAEPTPPISEVAPPVVLVAEPAPRTVTLDKPLRSGQRFYARGSDLIVTAMISAGAEVIADGNIHIYAPLRGRHWPAPVVKRARGFLPPAWKPNWFPSPGFTAPSRRALLPNWHASRQPSAWSTKATTCA